MNFMLAENRLGRKLRRRFRKNNIPQCQTGLPINFSKRDTAGRLMI
jgi:hypothetical protein